MAARSTRRFIKPLLYTSAAAAIGAGVLYISYRPRNIPGSEPAAVPPPSYSAGKLIPPNFPRVKPRHEQILDLKRSSGAVDSSVFDSVSKKSSRELVGSGSPTTVDDESSAEVYDLLVIGGGATGSGIALDATTRGLKVAVIERDDFASGTSSKSTKLVHGGVRYLEKAVWELDYSQYGSLTTERHDISFLDHPADYPSCPDIRW